MRLPSPPPHLLLALLAVALALAVFLVSVDADSNLHAPSPPKCEDASSVDAGQARQLRQLIQPLVSSPFFGIFHVAVDAPCPFWKDDTGKCAMRECSVCDCPENDVPAMWRNADAASAGAAKEKLRDGEDAGTARAGCPAPQSVAKGAAVAESSSRSAGYSLLHDIDRTHSEQTSPMMRNWALPSSAEDWIVEEDGTGVEKIYVDLRKNPERYTGFSGEESNRIWRAIYDENCFAVSSQCSGGLCAPGTCKEERVFYRLVSGVHTSITTHIAKAYLHGSRWGHNLDIFRNRVRANPEYVKNLYMTLAVVLRAVAKVAPSLDPSVFPFKTGDEVQDTATSKDIRAFLAHPLLARGCEQLLFNESDMFVASAQDRLPEFRGAFRNISKIMDCVGCEKCRLWGKLQFLGLGMSLRILFSENDEYDLKRNEVIALFNFLHKLLSSVIWYEELTIELERKASLYKLGGQIGGAFLFLFVCLGLRGRSDRTRRRIPTQPHALAKSKSAEDGAGGREAKLAETPRGATLRRRVASSD